MSFPIYIITLLKSNNGQIEGLDNSFDVIIMLRFPATRDQIQKALNYAGELSLAK